MGAVADFSSLAQLTRSSILVWLFTCRALLARLPVRRVARRPDFTAANAGCWDQSCHTGDVAEARLCAWQTSLAWVSVRAILVRALRRARLAARGISLIWLRAMWAGIAFATIREVASQTRVAIASVSIRFLPRRAFSAGRSSRRYRFRRIDLCAVAHFDILTSLAAGPVQFRLIPRVTTESRANSIFSTEHGDGAVEGFQGCEGCIDVFTTRPRLPSKYPSRDLIV